MIEGNFSFVKRECVFKDVCIFYVMWNVFFCV